MQKTILNTLLFCVFFTISYQIVTAQTISYRDIVINEIMADPSPVVGLPEKEFVEIYNRSNQAIDLTGWTIKDASTTKGTLPASTIEPGAYAIICKSADASLFSPFGQVIIASTLPSLNNDADSIILRNAQGELIDMVYYKDSWYGTTVKKEGGYTLELINPSLICSDATNWIGSNATIGGTPGTANSVLSNIPDITPPSILSYAVTSSNTILLTFSEAIDIITAENPNLYLFSPKINIQQVTFGTDKKSAVLTLAENIEAGISYELKIFGISDCEGNSMAEKTFTILLGETPGFNDLLITEIMADPNPPILLPDNEYIEIYNRTDKAIDLKGLTFGSGSRTVILPEAQLLPKEYAVITSIDFIEQYPTAQKIIGVSGFPTLTNSGADLILKNSKGELIYQITYSDSWYASTSKKEGGWSLEMIDLSQPCAGRENWKEAQAKEGGTPGLPNSVQGTITEALPLKPVSISYLSNNVIQVLFNGKINLSQLNNYQVNINPNLPINSIVPILPSADKIEISFQDIIPNSQLYEITISGFYDCAGNIIEPTTLKFGVPDSVSHGDFVINEILYDPKSGGEDFVELINVSHKILSLSELILTREDAITGDIISNVNLKDNYKLLLPNDYIVLSGKGESIRGQYTTPGPGVFADVSGFPNFVSDGGGVGIYNQKYEAIDRVTYTPKMHFKLLDITKGVSLERVNPKAPSNEKSNWNSAAISIGGATPGYQNSQYLQAVPKGDLSVSPEVFSPDNDGIDDLLGINYELDKTGFVGTINIYTIEGIPVRKLFSQETLAQQGFVTWDGLDDNGKKARVGIYVVVLEIFDLDGNKDMLRAKCVVAAR